MVVCAEVQGCVVLGTHRAVWCQGSRLACLTAVVVDSFDHGSWDTVSFQNPKCISVSVYSARLSKQNLFLFSVFAYVSSRWQSEPTNHWAKEATP